MGLEVEPWKKDEEGFRAHFDIPYGDFCTLIEAFDEDRSIKYEKIRGVHEEAAILWAIHEGKRHGLLKEVA